MTLPESNSIYINNNYLCVLYDASYLNMNDKVIEDRRKEIVKSNPSVPEYFYRTESILFLSFSQVYKLLKEDNSFSQRITTILTKLFENKEFLFDKKRVVDIPKFLKIISKDTPEGRCSEETTHINYERNIIERYLQYYDDEKMALVAFKDTIAEISGNLNI